FLTESGLLAALGGLVSLAFAYTTANLLVAMVPAPETPLRVDIDFNLQFVAITVTASALAVLLFGLLPAWRATRLDLIPSLREGSGSVGVATHSWWTPGKLLVIAQVAFALVLVAAAAIFARNLQRMGAIDIGFDRSSILLADVKPGEAGYQGD